MALVVTPGQLAKRSEFYYQLAQLIAAGVGLIPALEYLLHHPPSRVYVKPVNQLVRELGHGFTFAESLVRIGPWAPDFDVALLNAGEQSGRLDACFKILADYYRERAQLFRQTLADLAYPLFVLHVAIFIFPFAQFFISGNALVYLGQTLGVLAPFYLVTGVLFYILQDRRGRPIRAVLERLLRLVPVFGSARKALAVSRLCAALESLLSAGVTIIEAWDMAAAASGSPAIQRTVAAWKPELQGGRAPAELVGESGEFPDLFVSQYAGGEMSGKLDEVLRRLHEYYRNEGSRKLHALAQWLPRLAYLGILLYIAYRVVHFWSGYFKQISDTLNF